MWARQRILVVLVLLSCVLTFSPGCRRDQQSTQHRSASLPAWLSLDGSLADWKGVTPIVQEVGLPGRGSFNGINVTRLFLKTDSRNLYLFACCEPSVASRFQEANTTCGLFDMFLDTDGRADTGTPNTKRSWNDGLPGSDCKIVVGSGIIVDLLSRKSKPNATAWVLRCQNGVFPGKPAWETDSDDATAYIAHGPDGVEVAIPLDALGLKPGATVYALVVEGSHFSDEQALNEITFTVAGD